MLAKVKQIEEEAAYDAAMYHSHLEGHRNLCFWSNVDVDMPVFECRCAGCTAYEPPTVHFDKVAAI